MLSKQKNIDDLEEKGQAERTRRRVNRGGVDDEESLALLKPANIRE